MSWHLKFLKSKFSSNVAKTFRNFFIKNKNALNPFLCGSGVVNDATVLGLDELGPTIGR